MGHKAIYIYIYIFRNDCPSRPEQSEDTPPGLLPYTSGHYVIVPLLSNDKRTFHQNVNYKWVLAKSICHLPLQGVGFPGSSAGKESTCNAEDPSLIPGSGRYPGEGTGYPL